MTWWIAMLAMIGAAFRMDDPIGLLMIAAAQFAMGFIAPDPEPPHDR